MHFSDPAYNVAQFGIQLGDHVADLGGGTGRYATLLAEAVELPGKVYVVDLQKDILRDLTVRARSLGITNIVTVVADIETPRGTGFEEKSMDAALIANVLFQLEDKYAFLKETFRILRSGGRALVIDWKGSFKGIGPSEKYLVLEDSLREITDEIGFTFDRSINAGEYHYGLIFRK